MEKVPGLTWWQLGALSALSGGLLAADAWLRVPETWHGVIVIGIAFLVASIGLRWFAVNDRAAWQAEHYRPTSDGKPVVLDPPAAELDLPLAMETRRAMESVQQTG